MTAFTVSLSSSALAGGAGNLTASNTFIENRGQWNAQALFLAKTGGMNVWITGDGPVFDARRYVPARQGNHAYLKGQVFKLRFANAQPTIVSGEEERETKLNYFFGKDRSRWATGVKTYGSVRAEQPYKGISVRYSLDKGKPEYDLIVKPGSNPSQVALKVEGADGVKVESNGNLRIRTSLGDIEESGLFAYQDSDNGRTRVPCRMVMDGDKVRFDAGSYDTSKPLIIDPLVASTYLGAGTSEEQVNRLATDSAGNIYVAGTTGSPSFPTTLGAYQTSSDSNNIAYVSKLNSDESKLIYSTFLAGSGIQTATSIALDSGDNAYVTGVTSSIDFPVTAGAFQTTTTTTSLTCFVTKLNAFGSELVFSTYLGGSTGPDNGTSITVDPTGHAFVTGFTDSTDFPTTQGAFQSTNASIGYEGFVTRLNPSGSELAYSTFLGGTKATNPNSISLDASGEATIGGQTLCTDFPTTSGAFQTNDNEGNGTDPVGFVTRLNASGTALVFSTYLGGSSGDDVVAIKVDPSGATTCLLSTYSSDFPTTTGAFETTNPTGNTAASAALTRLDSKGKTLLFSTFFSDPSGSSVVNPHDLALDQFNNVVFVGSTNSNSLYTTNNAYQTKNTENGSDGFSGFVAEISSDGSTLNYGSYLGGTGDGGQGDVCVAAALNPTGYVVTGGLTSSFDFPITSGALETDSSAGDASYTGFVSTLDIYPFAGFNVTPNPIVSGGTANGAVTFYNSSTTEGNLQLTSTGPISLPASVPYTLGSTTLTFSVTADTVKVATNATITATIFFLNTGSLRPTPPALTQTISVTVVPAPLASLSLFKSSIVGGESTIGTVNTAIKANYGSISVALASSSNAVTVPATVTIPQNGSSVTFPIQTTAVKTATAVRITASYGGDSVIAILTVDPPDLSTLQLQTNSLIGGVSTDGYVGLTGIAPTGNLTVGLSSSNPVVKVPTQVVIAKGQSEAPFTLATLGVSTQAQSVITATLGSTQLTQTLTVNPAGIKGLVVAPSSLVGHQQYATGVVQLNGQVGAATAVNLASNSPYATVPGTVTVPAGTSGIQFSIQTYAVSSTMPVSITATLNSTMVTASFSVVSQLTSLVLTNSTVVGETGTMATLTVPLPAGTKGETISLVSSNPSVASVPANVQIMNGRTSAQFQVNTSAVTKKTVVVISATLNGSVASQVVTVTNAP